MVFEFARGVVHVGDGIPPRQRQANDVSKGRSGIGKSAGQLIEMGKAEDIHRAAVCRHRAGPPGTLRIFSFLDDAGEILETPIPRVAVRHLAGLPPPAIEHVGQIREMIGNFGGRQAFPGEHLARLDEPLTGVTGALAEVFIAPGIDEVFFNGHLATYFIPTEGAMSPT